MLCREALDDSSQPPSATAMSAHELRTDLATLYAAANAAAAAGGDPAPRRALLRCLLREGMRRVSGGEAQLQPVPFEALQAALLRAAMADAQLSGFDANGPALPKLLHQLVSAGLVGWGGSTSGRRSVVALRADRLLERLCSSGRQRAQRSHRRAPLHCCPVGRTRVQTPAMPHCMARGFRASQPRSHCWALPTTAAPSDWSSLPTQQSRGSAPVH